MIGRRAQHHAIYCAVNGATDTFRFRSYLEATKEKKPEFVTLAVERFLEHSLLEVRILAIDIKRRVGLAKHDGDMFASALREYRRLKEELKVNAKKTLEENRDKVSEPIGGRGGGETLQETVKEFLAALEQDDEELFRGDFYEQICTGFCHISFQDFNLNRAKLAGAMHALSLDRAKR